MSARRPDDSATPTRRPEVEALLTYARELVLSADYRLALDTLAQATLLAPDDAEIHNTIDQIERAEARHTAAVERQRAAAASAGDVEALIDAGDLRQARRQLEQARSVHGKHPDFAPLARRLEASIEDTSRNQAEVHGRRAAELLDKGDWQGALHQAEQALGLDSQHDKARTLRERARLELEADTGRQRRLDAIGPAEQDIERLISGGELPRAEARRLQAIDEFGNSPIFDTLGERIDQAKLQHLEQQQSEWQERRANESRRLIEEAALASYKGDFAEAINKLEAALELAPEDQNLLTRLDTARTARDRQLEQQASRQQLDAEIRVIEAELDAMHLEAARAALAELRRRVAAEHDAAGDAEPVNRRLDELAGRLEQLRLTTADGDRPVDVSPNRLHELTVAQRRQMTDRERAFDAYTFRQALAFPLRDHGLRWLFGIAVALIAIDTLLTLAAASPAVHLVRRLAPLLLLAIWPAITRATIAGSSTMPPLTELAPSHRPTGRSAISWSALVLIATLVLIPMVATLTSAFGDGVLRHSLTAGLIAVTTWLASALLLAAVATSTEFAPRHAWHLHRHPRSLAIQPRRALRSVDVVAALALASIVAHVSIKPLIPWLGIPIAGLTEAYALLLTPHLAGDLLRRRRLAWAQIHAPTPSS